MPTNWKKLIPAGEIAARIAASAATIVAHYGGEEIVIVAVLNGSLFFVADLARALRCPVRVDTLLLQSYGAATVSSGKVEMRHDVRTSLRGKHVLLVDDIYDSGRTLRFALDHLATQHPRSLEVACLLTKDVPHAVPVEIKFNLINIPNEFVVGYGLDLDGLGRNLPDIWAIPAGTPEHTAKDELLAQLSEYAVREQLAP